MVHQTRDRKAADEAYLSALERWSDGHGARTVRPKRKIRVLFQTLLMKFPSAHNPDVLKSAPLPRAAAESPRLERTTARVPRLRARGPGRWFSSRLRKHRRRSLERGLGTDFALMCD